MRIPFWMGNSLIKFADRIFKHITRPRPDLQQLRRCKIVSHRGEHDNQHVFENTIAAFDRVQAHGAWGIELDVRWTRDLLPVVFHDKNTQRLFQNGTEICRVTFAELNAAFPLIPKLEDVIERYGVTMHLMVEIKEEFYPDSLYQNRVLKEIFKQLQPVKDYHLISLAPQVFDLIDFVPAPAFLPVAELNVKHMSKMAVEKKYGGLLGHYALLNHKILKKHHSLGQKVGTGFIESKNCLFRELNRHVEWLFTNNTVELQAILNSCL